MLRDLHRRDALRVGLAALAAPVGLGMAPPRGVRSFRLIESAGLRRFGFPVSATVPDAAGGRNFRLVRDGRAIPAQFRESEGRGGRPELILDFTTDLGPMDSARHEVHFGPEVEPGPEPSTGLKVDRRDGSYVVSQPGGLAFEVADDLGGFLRSVGSARLGYVRGGSAGLGLRKAGGEIVRVGGGGQGLRVESSLTRHGPMAVGLRFATDPAAMVVDLTFPRSKTWVRADLTLDDPGGKALGLALDLDLIVEGPPTLVDFGAGSTVYGQVAGRERMELAAGPGGGGPSWTVRRGEGDAPGLLAASSPESPRPAEGWAHVMDARRCSALAVADFGRGGAADSIRVEADGSTRLARTFAATKGPKSLTFWLHFVPMPVQVGAATSPQAILAPPRVEWDR